MASKTTSDSSKERPSRRADARRARPGAWHRIVSAVRFHKAEQRLGLREQYLISLVPGLLIAAATAFTNIAPVNPGVNAFLLWTPFEVAAWMLPLLVGPMWISYREMHRAHGRLDEANRIEENRRAIAAIGMAASWDLDIGRLYQRISQDLRSVLDYDRLTITSALNSGAMAVDFSSGPPEEAALVGTALPPGAPEPDGLLPEALSKYSAKLTAAIPARNGTITIRRSEGQYSAADLETLRQAIAQISPGIANAVMFQASELRVKERTVLAEIGRTATSATDPQVIIEGAVSSLGSLIEYQQLGVVLADESDVDHRIGHVAHWTSAIESAWNVGDKVEIDFNAVNPGLVAKSGRPEFASIVEERSTSTSIDWLQAPLVVQENVIGLVFVGSDRLGALGSAESSLLLSVCLQIAPAIQNARLTARLHRQAEERRAVARVGLVATSELDLKTIYDRVSAELADILEYDRLAISYVQTDGVHQETVYTAESDSSGKLSAWYVEESEPADPSHTSLPDENGKRLTSHISAPLGARPSVLGRISLSTYRETAYTPEDLDLLQRIATQITPAIHNARMIAAERELREKLDRQNNELYEANNARKQFLSTVSHELKTPLTIISGFIDLLASPEGAGDENERQETLGIIRRNADHLNVLINDILDISRLDAGTFKLSPAPFSANELISDLEASFQSLLRTKTQTLRVRVPEDETWIAADRSRISQVITNLLSNASKYSPESTEIFLGAEVSGERLILTVTDRGFGMTEDEQEGLFTPFFRADNEATRSVSGTGLGLVIAKSITELHGGEIRLESKVGEGTTIELSLPGLTTEAEAEQEEEYQPFGGSRLWPEGPPPEEPEADLELGAD